MKALEYSIPVTSRSEVFYIVPIGDIHHGTKNFDEDKFLDTIEWVRQRPNAYAILMGDYCEFINYTDRRFDARNVDERYLARLDNLHYEQARYIVKKFKPIKERIICMLTGNHDDKIRNAYHSDIMSYMSNELEVRNPGYSVGQRVCFRRGKSVRKVEIWAHHGHGGGSTSGGAINNLKKKAGQFDADVYLMGHVHAKIHENAIKIRTAGSGENIRLQAHKVIYAITGTFFKTYQDGQMSYAEKSGYSPTPTGALKLRIDPFAQERQGKWTDDLPADITVED